MNVHRFARSVWLRLPPALRRELAEWLALRPPAERPRRRESPVVAVTSRQTTAIADLHARCAATPNAASPRPETGPPPAGPLAIAVVVPVYNGGAWLSDCLESVRRQTYDAWRCYVVDDASTDETAATASSFAARDSRFVALRHGRNAGLSASRNTGLAHAGEPLVTFLDADDLLTPSSLRRREAVMRRHWRDTAVAGAWGDTPTVGQDVTVADSGTFERDSPRKPTVHADSHGGECPFNVHAPLLRADLLRRLGGFDERLRRGAEDWDLWHRLLRHGYTLEHARGSAGLYRRRPQEEIQTAAASASREDEDDAPSVDCSPLLAEPDVVVVAETAADVRSLVGFVRRLRARGWDAVALDADYARGDQGATRAWQRADVPLIPCNHLRFGRVRAARMLVCRPFGPLTAGLAAAVRSGGGVVVEWSAGVAEARLPCNDTESTSCDGRWTADMQVPEKKPGVSLDPVAIRAGRTESPADSVRTDAGLSFPGPATHCLDIVREEDPLDHESTALIESLRDRHRGETVVVIGNGPSLNDTDLGLLAGVATIGVNGIFYAQDRLPEPLTYYVVEDTSVFRENTAAIKAFECGCKLFPTLYRPAFRDDEIDRARVGFFRMNMGFYGRGTRTLCLPRFSTDAVQRLYCGQSVTLINLQLAWWMGFSRVVLIGMDFSYTIPPDADREGNLIRSNSDDVNHFHPDYFGKGKTWKDPKLDRVLANYALAREMFAADGREIVNATVGGRLELFRRMPLAQALGEAARSSEPPASRFRAAAPPTPRPGRPAPRDAAVPVPESRKNVGSVASVTASKNVRPYSETKRRVVSNDGAASGNVASGGAMKKNHARGRPSVVRFRKRLPIPTVAVMALGLILTGAGFSDVVSSDVASRWWIGASGLLLVGLVAAKESILWRWRREQLREELAGQRRRAEQALAAERRQAGQALTNALAAERKRAEQALTTILTAERKRTEQALTNVLAAEQKRAEQALETALAAERKQAEQALTTLTTTLAAERKRAEQALTTTLAAERKRAEQALTTTLAAERKRAEQALTTELAAERKRAEQALTTERSRRSLVDAHLADRGLPVRRILLLFTIHRSGSTWLFDMLRTHPAVRTEPTARVWTELGIEGGRYPHAFHDVDGARFPMEITPEQGAAIPEFPQAVIPDVRHVDESDRWTVEKAHPQFVGFNAARLGGRIRNLRARGVDVEVVYGVRGPLDAMWSMAEFKTRDPVWYSFLPIEDVPRFIAHSLDVLAALHALVGGTVVEYETLPDGSAMNTLCQRLDTSWNDAAVKAWLAHAAAVTERSKRRQRSDSTFLGDRNRLRNPDGPDRAWIPHAAAIEAANAAWARLVALRTGGDTGDRTATAKPSLDRRAKPEETPDAADQ